MLSFFNIQILQKNSRWSTFLFKLHSVLPGINNYFRKFRNVLPYRANFLMLNKHRFHSYLNFFFISPIDWNWQPFKGDFNLVEFRGVDGWRTLIRFVIESGIRSKEWVGILCRNQSWFRKTYVSKRTASQLCFVENSTPWMKCRMLSLFGKTVSFENFIWLWTHFVNFL